MKTLAALTLCLFLSACEKEDPLGEPDFGPPVSGPEDESVAQASALERRVDPVVRTARRLVEEGRQTFRFDTFGDEAFWGGALRLHEAIEGEALGGVGPGISPNVALALGLVVDVDALPHRLVSALQRGEVDLDDPAVTVALLGLDAVVGIHGIFGGDRLESVGIHCALCHSTVDDSLVPGIGHRLDGWPNRKLDVGAIIAAAPDLSPIAGLLGIDQGTLRSVLATWGPGKFDAAVLLDGQAVGPTGSAATLIPPAYGLAGVNLHTYTGWGSVPYWNAFVANLEMQGQGTFFDPRLDDETRFPIAAANQFGHRTGPTDRITSKLAALQFYQLALEAPAPPARSFDAKAARRGASVFAASCARCHVPPLYTEPGWNLHEASEIGIDDFQASRSPDGRYRTTPLKGLWSHQTGGFYHDGRFATLADVVDHYDSFLQLGLRAQDKSDLVQYLLSL